MKNLSSTLILILLLLSLVPLNGGASQINIHIEGPNVIGVNQDVGYKVYVEGFFSEYKCGLIISGINLTGASPVNELIKSSKQGYFIFNITAPSVAQTIQLNFRVYGMRNNKTIGAIGDRILKVDVKEVMDIKVKIKNVESYEIKNVKLSFYLDGRYIGNTTVDKIAPNSTESITYKWVPEGIYQGEHTLTVKISSEGVVFENDLQTYQYKFYYGPPPSYDYITYLSWGLLILVSTLFTLFYFGRRGRKAGPAPKWKK
ncbi:CARDB domain-containing protein [Euryarchaeota archaeon ex4484_178]|nr:MAG: CARDB domain-containing protein [Euryarchaeota archaeon ex4484_178]